MQWQRSADLESLEGLLLCDSDVGLLQRDWTETVVEVEQSLGRVNTQESGHILVQNGGQERGRERGKERGRKGWREGRRERERDREGEREM